MQDIFKKHGNQKKTTDTKVTLKLLHMSALLPPNVEYVVWQLKMNKLLHYIAPLRLCT